MGKRNFWNKEKMQQHCDEADSKYTVLDIKWIEKPYQKQQWALVKCPNENHEPYWVWWNNFLHGYRCKECDYDNKEKIKWNSDIAYNFLLKYGYKIVNKNDWKNVDTCIECEDEFGFKYNISITNLRQKIQYNRDTIFWKFNINNPFSMYNIKLYCKLYRPDYCLAYNGKYKGVKEKYLFKYIGIEDIGDDDPYFETTLDNFVNGNVGHPHFTKIFSIGERRAKIFFEEYNINYVQQKTFEDCKDEHVLPFDFYLPDFNMCVEIMGRQHDEEVGFFGGKYGYWKRLKHDQIKRSYLKEHNIECLDIWYYDFDKIEDILYKQLIDDKIAEINNKLKGEQTYEIN